MEDFTEDAAPKELNAFADATWVCLLEPGHPHDSSVSDFDII
jgi:hypothetical protein